MVAPLARTTQSDACRMGANSSQADLLLFLCDLLASMARLHGQRARALLMSSDAIDGVVVLLAAKLAHLRLAALRVIKACIGQHDDAFGRYLIAHGVFGTVVELLATTLPRDNLVSSACRELLALVANHGHLALLAHILGAHSKALEKSPDTLEFLRQTYDARTAKADDARSGGLATPTVDASRRSAVPANMPGLPHGGPWASAVTDEIEDAYLESLDECSDHGSPSGAASSAPVDSDSWGLDPRSPELDSLQECLGILSAGETRPPPAEPPQAANGKCASAGLGRRPPHPLKRQGSSVDAGGPEAAPDGQPLLSRAGMSVSDAFPDSRPVGRRLSKRGLGGRSRAASQIKISMALSVQPRPASVDDS
ncbi:Platinum sensitivity protein, partial [Coemansia spiralis]